MAKFNNPTKVITGVNTRWSYVNAWEAKSINGGAPKFSVSLIIPKSDTRTIEKIQAAIQAAYEEGQGKLKGNGICSGQRCSKGCGFSSRRDDTGRGSGGAFR